MDMKNFFVQLRDLILYNLVKKELLTSAAEYILYKSCAI